MMSVLKIMGVLPYDEKRLQAEVKMWRKAFDLAYNDIAGENAIRCGI